MSKLQSSLYHNPDDEHRTLEVQFVEDKVFLSIAWKPYHGGIRAESFTLESDQAYRIATDILEHLKRFSIGKEAGE